MEITDKLSGYAKEWFRYLKEFFKIHVSFLTYEFGELLFVVASILVSRFVSICLLVLSGVFGSGALAFYLGHILGSLPLSFTLIGLGYASIAWIVFKIRPTWATNHSLAFHVKSVFNPRNLNIKTMKEYPNEFGNFLEEKEKIRIKKIQINGLLHRELIRLVQELKPSGRLSKNLIPFIIRQSKNIGDILAGHVEQTPFISNGKFTITRVLNNYLKSLFIKKTSPSGDQKYPLYINE
ncbi:MAG: hypothetical protein ABIR66_10190 [Saprospiraceae bacterium]